ncbi:MAG: hypothetical protein ACKOEZ_12580, partial [Spartobacteria bacterium]
ARALAPSQSYRFVSKPDARFQAALLRSPAFCSFQLARSFLSMSTRGLKRSSLASCSSMKKPLPVAGQGLFIIS